MVNERTGGVHARLRLLYPSGARRGCCAELPIALDAAAVDGYS